jgi:hypothetical protein
MYSGRDLLLGGLFLALALVLPVLFHAAGLGSAFLPMFFPILLAGFFTAPVVALTVGCTAPLVSALLTGMPPFFPPIAFIMMLEGMALGGGTAWLHHKFRWGVYPTLIMSLILDRLVLFGSVLLAASWLDLPQGVLGIVSVVRGLPGIVLILVIIPPLVKSLEGRLKLLTTME